MLNHSIAKFRAEALTVAENETIAQALRRHKKLLAVGRASDSSPRLLYDRREAARQLSISVRSLDYLIAGGCIRVRRIGGRVLITHKELERFAANDRSEPLVAA